MPYFYEQQSRFQGLACSNMTRTYGALRWTVDTPEDLELVREIYARFDGRDDFSWLDVLRPGAARARPGADQRRRAAQRLPPRLDAPPLEKPTPRCRSSPSSPRPSHLPTRTFDVIQRNAIRSWLSLGARVEVLLVGDEAGMANRGVEYGVPQLAGVARNARARRWSARSSDLARQASEPAAGLRQRRYPAPARFCRRRRGTSPARRPVSWSSVSAGIWMCAQLLDFAPGWESACEAEVQGRGPAAPAGWQRLFHFPARMSSQICPISPSAAPAGITG